MADGIRTGDPRGFNNGRSSKFREGSRVRQTPEKGRRTYRPKRCGNNNKDEDNSPKNLNDKNQQASSQKFRQLYVNRTIKLSFYFFFNKGTKITFINVYTNYFYYSKGIWFILLSFIYNGLLFVYTECGVQKTAFSLFGDLIYH